MKRPFLVAILVLLGLMVGVPWGVMEWQRIKDERDLKAELALARAEGLATDWREFVAAIKPVPPAENAAPLYRKLDRLSRGTSDVPTLTADLVLKRRLDALAKANAQLKAASANLKIIDEATKRPGCVFERDWSQGAATLFPEFADMKAAARLLGLRGAVAASRKDAATAIEEARKVLVIAEHARQEPTSIAQLVSESITLIGLKALAQYAWMSDSPNDRTRFASAMERAIERWPKPDILKENRGRLFEVLSIIDLCATPEGRVQLGLKEDDVPESEKYMKLIFSQRKARIKVVQACRAYHAALKLPVGQRKASLDRAQQDLGAALLALPVAGKVYLALSAGEDNDWIAHREDRWEARRLQYRALARAVGPPRVPRSIQTSDLLSPFDSRPATYAFDGRQIVIDVSGLGQPLKFPTDSELNPKSP